MARRKKSRAAWASITDMGGGTFRIRYWAETPDGYRRCSKTIRGATRKDAERERLSLMLEHSDDAPCPTVGEAWRRWVLPDIERKVEGGDLSRQTLSMRMSAWRNHVSTRWEDVPCDMVRPLQVQQWIDTMGLSQARGATSLLRLVLDYAVRYEFVDHNPMSERYVMPAKSSIERKDRGVWSMDELGAIWRGAARGSWWEAAFLLAGFGGMRVGEALGVMACDVSEAETGDGRVALVSVRRQVMNSCAVLSETLKNQQSRREVPIAGAAGARVVELAGMADGLLTSSAAGMPARQGALGRAWQGAVSALGDGALHPFRNLRNSWQTNMRWTVGMEPYYIETAMGHSVGGVTGQHYDRPSPEQLASVFAAGWADYVAGGGVDPIAL